MLCIMYHIVYAFCFDNFFIHILLDVIYLFHRVIVFKINISLVQSVDKAVNSAH